MTETAWLWFYVACMAAGALLFFTWSRRPSGVPQFEYAVAMAIPIWSGLAYTSLALGQGTLLVDGREVQVARYLDWVVTTPLLLVALASTAMFYRRWDPTLFGGLIFTDVLMILSGLIADLSTDPDHKWFWYLNGCVCLAVILWIVWGPLRRVAYDQGKGLGPVYSKVAGLLTVLWFGYPTIWALGPSGLGLFGREADTALFVLLPIVSKVGFSIFDLSQIRKLGAIEPSHTVADHIHGTAYRGR